MAKEMDSTLHCRFTTFTTSRKYSKWRVDATRIHNGNSTLRQSYTQKTAYPWSRMAYFSHSACTAHGTPPKVEVGCTPGEAQLNSALNPADIGLRAASDAHYASRVSPA